MRILLIRYSIVTINSKAGGIKNGRKNKFSTKKSSLEFRVRQLEIHVDGIMETVESLKGKRKRKFSMAEKDAIKNELLKAGPYDKEKLDNLKGLEIKMLASAMKINAFGKNRDEITKLVLVKQKVAVKKK